MAYIGKVEVSNTWASLESLIQAQIDDQSAFAFASGSNYSLQVESGTVRVCNASATPTGDVDGEHLDENQFSKYSPDAGTLYVKAKAKSGVVLLSVSEI